MTDVVIVEAVRSPIGKRHGGLSRVPPLALLGAGTASALTLQVGDIVVQAEGGFSPKALPKHEDAPITLHGGGKLSTVSGALPPVLRELGKRWTYRGRHYSYVNARCETGRLVREDPTGSAPGRRPGGVVAASII
mgnify:CR=1 FL=1